jgi:pimeloyl-ACP methyl ester carboxylesterase
MTQTAEATEVPIPGGAFAEHHLAADGFTIRYLECGTGAPLVSFHGAGGPRIAHAHELLAERYRVILFEAPGFGTSPVNERSRSIQDLAETMTHAITALGLERVNLMGTSFGGRLALWLALQHPERIEKLILVSPAAFRPEEDGPPPPPGSAALYAHPERQPRLPPPDPAVVAKQSQLVQRLRGPARDPDLEARMATLDVPTLVLFGTSDQVIPPEMGRHYREKLPRCHLTLVYDAGHAIDGDRPEAFASIVDEFLEYGESYIVKRASELLFP